ncbi:hypothetical protein [Blastopirellula marina]|uniref:Uncharacterized protein n=1 Tax=Blastopirellula marina TaxID=124 RepID=A0A2S8GSS6_9BACT|nr:hypothetical protein [Blastopirellula marina]PQO47094.1 hypothetical protein C5Y93_06265 [Blastopirellula marina]
MKKLDLQNGGLKAKFILHIEKLVFGLAIVLVAAFIYFGTQQETIKTKPDELTSAAKQAQENIAKSTWAEVEEDRWTMPEYQAAAARASKPIPLNPYEMPVSLEIRHKESVERRSDPDLLAAESLEARGGFAPLATISPQQRMGGPGAGYGGREDAMSPGGGYGEYAGGSDASGYGGYGGYGSEMGMGQTNPDAPPVLTQEQRIALGPVQTNAGTEIKGTYFVAVTALVPLKKQLDLYNDVFKDRANFVEARDYPRYVHFSIQRREQNADGSWSEWGPNPPINVNQERLIANTRWGFRPDEVIPPEYADPVLTFPIPPVLLFDPAKWARHSEVPKYEPRDMMGGSEMDMAMEQPDPLMTPEISDAPGALPLTPGMGVGGMEGGYASPGGYGNSGGGYGNYPGGGMMNGGRMTAPEGMIIRPSGTSGGMGGMSGPGYGDGGGGYEMGGGYGAGTSMFDAEKKMFRFFDTSVSPDKTYQYRVQLWVEDPNMPQNPQQAPPARALEPTVIDRVKPERDKITQAMSANRGGGAGGYEGGMTASNQPPVHKFWRTTEFSEPSPPVRVPRSADVVPGPIDAGRMVFSRANTKQVLRPAEPSAKVVAMKWDPSEDVKALVTKEIKDVKRGSSVEYEGDLWVLDPTTYQFKKPWPIDTEEKNPEYELKTGYTVLDIRGGQDTFGRLSDEKNEKLRVPGEILVMDASGNIYVKSELEEVKTFAKFNFEKPEVKRGSNPGGMMDEMDMGSSYDGYGGGGGRGRRGRGGS